MDIYTMALALSIVSMGFYWFSTRDNEPRPFNEIGEEEGERTPVRQGLAEDYAPTLACAPAPMPQISSQEYWDAWDSLGVNSAHERIDYIATLGHYNNINVYVSGKYWGTMGNITTGVEKDIYWYARQNNLIRSAS